MEKNVSSSKLPVIVGLGSTGVSCARYFASKGLRFKVVDSRISPPGLKQFLALFPEVEVELGPFEVETLIAASYLVVSPGVGLKVPAIERARQAGVSITGDIDIFSQQVDAPIVAVTGSNGKSTVVAILNEILKNTQIDFAIGGNLDGDNFKPALDLLLEPEKQLYVLELSSFQLETARKLNAAVAVVLNLSEDHMDRYESLEEYYQAKANIFNGCDQVLINRDDKFSERSRSLNVPVWEFGQGLSDGRGPYVSEIDGDECIVFEAEKIVPLQELRIVGSHNVSNMLAAIGLALAIDVSLESIQRGVKNFSGLPHRCQWVSSLHGVDFYNDSKATNVGAAVAAITGLGQRVCGKVVLIAGGDSKGADFSDLAPVVCHWCKCVVLIGKDADKLNLALGETEKILFAKTMEEAVTKAFSSSAEGDVVLLSPACASFDMYENFQHRGQAFIRAVEELQ